MQTIESRWGASAALTFRLALPPPVYLWPLYLGNHPRTDLTLPRGDAKTPVVEVRVNHGVWQARCPFCPSAQHASPEDRLFYCAACMNARNRHRTLPVVWPPNREEIEAQLAQRPEPRHRNWEPGETLADLERQDEVWKEVTGG